MFDPDKLNEFLRKQASAMQDAILKGNKASFDDFFAKLKDAGVFKDPNYGNPNQGFAAQGRAFDYVFGPNFRKMKLNIKDFENQLSSIERLFNSKVLRMFAPLKNLLDATKTGSRINEYMHYRQRVMMEKQALDRLMEQEKKLEALRMLHRKRGPVYTDKGSIDKMLADEEKYYQKLDNINSKLKDRRKLLDEIGGIHKNDKSTLALARSALMKQLAKDVLEGIMSAILLQLASGYKELRNRGEYGTQAARNVGRAFGSQLSLLGHGVFATNSDVAKNIGQLGNSIGTINVNKALTNSATFLTEHDRLSPEQAGTLTSMFYRMSGFSGKIAANMVNVAHNMAVDNFYPSGTLLRDMANDTDIFARHAAQGVEAFARGEMLTKRMGTNMKSMEGFADRLVGDFENSLRVQAQLQTYMPDFDMSEIMFASQFGSTEDVTKALRTQMKGRDISKMPRSFQTAIQQATGLSFSELQGLNKGSEFADVKGGASAQQDVMKSFATSVMDFISANARVIVALNVLATVVSGVAGKMGLAGGLGGFVGGLGSKLGYATGGLAALGAGAGAFMSARGSGRGLGASLLQGGLASGLTVGAGLLGQTLIPIPGVGFAIGATVGGLASSLGASMWNAHVKHGGGMVGTGLTRSVSSLAFLGAGRFHSGLLPNEFPTILQRGEAVLTVPQQRHIANVTGVAMEAAKIGESLSQQGYNGGSVYSSVGSDTATIEHLLRQLIYHTKQGKNFYMDSKKVGSAIIEAYNRDE